MVRIANILLVLVTGVHAARHSYLMVETPTEQLEALASMDDARGRRSLMRKIAKSGALTSDNIAKIVEVLMNDPDGDVRRAAAGALGRAGQEKIGGKGTDALLNCLQNDAHDAARRDCAFQFGRLKEFSDSVPMLIKAVEDKNAEVRRESIVSLGKIAFGSGNEVVMESVPLIAAALKADDDDGVRREAAVALGVMKNPVTSGNLAGLIYAAKNDKSKSVRIEGVRAMIYLIGDNEAVQKAAVALKEISAEDTDADVQAAATNMLKRMRVVKKD